MLFSHVECTLALSSYINSRIPQPGLKGKPKLELKTRMIPSAFSAWAFCSSVDTEGRASFGCCKMTLAGQWWWWIHEFMHRKYFTRLAAGSSPGSRQNEDTFLNCVLATRATFVAGTKNVSERSSETFLVSARRTTTLPRFATDAHHLRTHGCRHNASSFCRGQKKKKFGTLHEFACHPCARGHANLLCIVPILLYVLPELHVS